MPHINIVKVVKVPHAWCQSCLDTFTHSELYASLLTLTPFLSCVQKCVAKGYTPIATPDLVRAAVLEKCGFQPRMANTQNYTVADSDLCLTGTAEVPLGGMYMNQIIDEAKLPIRMAAFGHCFRTEAGAAGMAGKGLYRVHQFSKVEMFVICTPEQSESLLQELLDIEVRSTTLHVLLSAVLCTLQCLVPGVIDLGLLLIC